MPVLNTATSSFVKRPEYDLADLSHCIPSLKQIQDVNAVNTDPDRFCGAQVTNTMLFVSLTDPRCKCCEYGSR